jgi:TonB dependent receptor/TonB-dependent Receptor Plug Domain
MNHALRRATSRTVIRCLLLLLSVAALLTAQPRRPAAATEAAPGFTSLAAASSAIGGLLVPVTVHLVSQPLSDVLSEISRQSSVAFATDAAHPGMQVIRDFRVTAMPARDAIQRALVGSPFTAVVSASGQVIIAAPPAPSPRDVAASQPGLRFRLSGYIRSRVSLEVVRRAQLVADNGIVRGESNDDGFYSLLLAPGTHRLIVRAIGFAPIDTSLTISASVTRDLLMNTRKVTLAAVTVQADANGDRPDLDPRTPDMSVVRLDLAAVKLLPPVLGEPDPIRSLTLLPGVSLSSDASTAFSVRGGAADQNLFLLDEATIYNPSHILGFLSTFNTDAVDNVTLYKGAIPARFGGRLSSVVDVRQREGNAKEFAGSASIGLLASRLALEGPLPGSRGSYMFAARRSYADVFARASSDSAIRDAIAYFYDVNAKTNLRLGSSGALLLSGYLGRDKFGQGAGFAAGWGNKAATLRWNQAFGGRLFSKVTAAWGDYDYRLDVPIDTRDSITWSSRIRSLDLKVDQTLYLSDRNSLEFGAQLTDQEFRPGTVTPRGSEATITRREVPARFGIAPAVYVGQELQLGARVAVRYGLRFAGFLRQGPATITRYRDDAPVVYNGTLGRYEPGVPRDSVRYTSRQRIASFSGLEPRLSARVMLTDASSLKASYSRTQQFLSLASKTNSVSPLDVWEPAGPYVKPLVSDQFAVGYSRATPNYELSIEGYYKQSENLVDFIDGADVVLNPRIETLLVQGNGRAYGMELLARRSTGRTTGWISYTLGRAEQRFPVPANAGAALGGGINGGQYYPSPFDKTHNLSVVAIRPIGRKWTLGSTFALASGLPATFPVARYQIDGLLVTEYGPRNGARLPLYHRLDVSATRQFSRGELQLGVLNVYNRFNAQALRFRQQQANPLVAEAVQTAIFGIVPSVAYAFRF